jgi:hypothetical protein
MNTHFDDITARVRRFFTIPGGTPDLSPETVTEASQRSAPRLVNRARVTQVAVGAFSAVALLGVGSLVIASSTPPAPLFTAAGSSGGAGNAEMASDALSSKMMGWTQYEYVAGADLSTEKGRGNVFQLQRVGDPKLAAAKVAAVFGLSSAAPVVVTEEGDFATYTVGALDGSAPSITLAWSGTGNWWYNNPAAYPMSSYPSSSCAEEGGFASDSPALDSGSSDAGEEVYPVDEEIKDCLEFITVPEAIQSRAPGEKDAAVLAADLLTRTGYAVQAEDVQVYVEEWGTTATAYLTVQGVQTSVEYSVSWTQTGEIGWASGHLVQVLDRGQFDTVSEKVGVDRLNDGRWYGSAGPKYNGNLYWATDTLMGEGTVGYDTPAEYEVPASDMTVDKGTLEPGVDGDMSMPVQDWVEPEPVQVTVTTAETTLVLVWDGDGNAWLVPGFAYLNTDGNWWTAVLSVVDGVIALPEPNGDLLTPMTR